MPRGSGFSRPPLRGRHSPAVMAAGGSGGHAARELFAEGLLQFLRPAVRQLDGHVHAVRSGSGRTEPGRTAPEGRE